MEMLMEYMGKGLITMLMISMPCVLVAAGVGLVVGILQAVTQVQEQTIAAAPKILAVFLVLMIMGMGYIKLLTNLLTEGLLSTRFRQQTVLYFHQTTTNTQDPLMQNLNRALEGLINRKSVIL